MIRVGTSGFGYHEWSSGIYPSGLPYEDYLSHYAGRFPCCELNQTFFRVPAIAEMERFRSRVPPSFRFTAKLNRLLTHERGDSFALARRFRDALRPLEEGGQLGAVLAQFPFAFVNHPYNRAYLCRLHAALELPVVVELRNGSWQNDETFDFLRGWGIGWVVLDAPPLAGIAPPSVVATSEVGYVRFHGRNAEAWWQRDASDRYRYRYRKRELQSWLPRIGEIARHARSVFVVFNNPGNGNAVANASRLLEWLEESERRKAGVAKARAR